MSSSRQRRINGPPSAQQPTSPPASQTQGQTQGKITLPEVLQIIEFRLNRLDKQFSDISKNDNNNAQSQDILKDFVSEADSRFDMLAIEINNLKDIVLKLQTFTMEVNKKLFDERRVEDNVLAPESIIIASPDPAPAPDLGLPVPVVAVVD